MPAGTTLLDPSAKRILAPNGKRLLLGNFSLPPCGCCPDCTPPSFTVSISGATLAAMCCQMGSSYAYSQWGASSPVNVTFCMNQQQACPTIAPGACTTPGNPAGACVWTSVPGSFASGPTMYWYQAGDGPPTPVLPNSTCICNFNFSRCTSAVPYAVLTYHAGVFTFCMYVGVPTLCCNSDGTDYLPPGYPFADGTVFSGTVSSADCDTSFTISNALAAACGTNLIPISGGAATFTPQTTRC